MSREYTSREPQKRSQKTAALVLLFGILLVVIGILYQAISTRAGQPLSVLDQVAFGVLIAVGGGIIGSSLNTLIVRRFEWDALDEVGEIIATSLTARFVSDENALVRYRELWHSYHVTEVDGSVCWWYEAMDLRRGAQIGALSSSTSVNGPSGRSHQYLSEVGYRSGRLIRLVTRRDDSELAYISIFPSPRGHGEIHTGVAIHETWDSTDILTRVMICLNPVIEGLLPGRIDDAHRERLDQLWEASFRRTVRVEL